MSFQHLKEVRDEVDFQQFGHQCFLQGDTIIIDGHNQAFSKYSKFAISLQNLKKEVRNGVHLLHADKHQNFTGWHCRF